jgi:hypothetical protein
MLKLIKPISVWHQQPFELPILREGMILAFVYYRNPSIPGSVLHFWKNIYLIKNGEPFGAVGNIGCPLIRTWQFRSYFSLPKEHTIPLNVLLIQNKRFPNLSIPFINLHEKRSKPIMAVSPNTSSNLITTTTREIKLSNNFSAISAQVPHPIVPEFPITKSFEDSI